MNESKRSNEFQVGLMLTINIVFMLGFSTLTLLAKLADSFDVMNLLSLLTLIVFLLNSGSFYSCFNSAPYGFKYIVFLNYGMFITIIMSVLAIAYTVVNPVILLMIFIVSLAFTLFIVIGAVFHYAKEHLKNKRSGRIL